MAASYGRRRADGAAGLALVLGGPRRGRARAAGTGALKQDGEVVEVLEVGGGCDGPPPSSTTSTILHRPRLTAVAVERRRQLACDLPRRAPLDILPLQHEEYRGARGAGDRKRADGEY